jgi:GT2 family glycosyltransferase
VDGVHELCGSRTATRYLAGPGQGFARAANLGARTSQARYVVFVNPDSAPTVEQLDALVSDLEADDRLAAVGATTVLPGGRVELGVGGWEPTLGRALAHAVGVHALFRRAGLYARPVPGRPLELDWLSGACLAVPRQRFLDLGGFDEGFFVYNEDMAYGRRVREAHLRLRLRTDLLVPHLGGGSGEAKPRMFQMRGASMAQYVAAHNGAGTVLGVRLALSAGTGVRWTASTLRGRRSLARAHAAYLRGLWRGAPDLT